jgi:hypothetical protein
MFGGKASFFTLFSASLPVIAEMLDWFDRYLGPVHNADRRSPYQLIRRVSA